MNPFPRVDSPTFQPHALLAHAQAMTIFGALPRRGLERLVAREERRVVRVDDATRVRVHIDRPAASAPRQALILMHGLVGSAESVYMLGTAQKAVAAGMLAVRVNARGCGGTEELTTSAYNGGQTEELEAVAREIARTENVTRIHFGGFSIGANQVLRLASRFGSDGESAPKWLGSFSTVSPCIDFAASAEALERGFVQRLIQRRFVEGLKLIVRRQRALGRSSFAAGRLDDVRSIRDFDSAFTAPLSGFADVDDYYERASARRVLARIRTPTLLVVSRDDPLVPFASFDDLELGSAPVQLLVTGRGGHVGFIGQRPARTNDWQDLDRRWAENRIVEFAAAAGDG